VTTCQLSGNLYFGTVWWWAGFCCFNTRKPVVFLMKHVLFLKCIY